MLRVTPKQYDNLMDALSLLHQAGLVRFMGEKTTVTDGGFNVAEEFEIEYSCSCKP